MSASARIVALMFAALALLCVGYRHGMNVKQGEWDAARIAESQAHAAALQAAAREITKLETSAQVIKERVIRETVDRPVYRDCAHSDSVLHDINAAIAGQSVGPGELPASSPPD